MDFKIRSKKNGEKKGRRKKKRNKKEKINNKKYKEEVEWNCRLKFLAKVPTDFPFFKLIN